MSRIARFARTHITPVPPAILAVSLVTFWITGKWWIVLLGVLASVIMIVQSLISGDTEVRVEQGESPTYDLDRLHPDLRGRFRSILEEKDRFLRELEENTDEAFLNTGDIAHRVNALVDDYYDLLLKLEKIRPFIDPENLTMLNGSIEELKRRIDRCADAITRDNLSQALKSKMDQMKSLMELAKYRDRVDSQLFSLVSSLKSLYVRVVQLKLSPDSSLDPTSEIKESINGMLMDVEVSEEIAREYSRIVSESSL